MVIPGVKGRAACVTGVVRLISHSRAVRKWKINVIITVFFFSFWNSTADEPSSIIIIRRKMGLIEDVEFELRKIDFFEMLACLLPEGFLLIDS